MKKMKLFSTLVCLGTLTFMLASCAKVNVAAVKETRKIALISVLAPERINVGAVTGKSPLGVLAAVAQDDATKLQPSMNKLKNAILKESQNIFKVPIVSEKSVISSKNYKKIDDKNWGSRIAPKGYKKIYPGQKEKILQAIKGLKGVGGALIVVADAKLANVKTDITGAKNALVQTTLTFHLYDKNGEEILMQGASRKSNKSIKSRAGLWRGNEMAAQIASSVKNTLDYVRKMIDDAFKKAESKKVAAIK